MNKTKSKTKFHKGLCNVKFATIACKLATCYVKREVVRISADTLWPEDQLVYI